MSRMGDKESAENMSTESLAASVNGMCVPLGQYTKRRHPHLPLYFHERLHRCMLTVSLFVRQSILTPLSQVRRRLFRADFDWRDFAACMSLNNVCRDA